MSSKKNMKSLEDIKNYNEKSFDDIAIFTKIYENCKWGDNENPDYEGSSGQGSSVSFTNSHYIPFVRNFIHRNDISTIVDLGCGDFQAGEVLYGDLDIEYIGVDAYEKVIRYHQKKYKHIEKFQFHHLNFRTNISELPEADLCILKDVLQHWNTLQIYIFLDELVTSQKFKYILICNCSCQQKENQDILPGEWRGLTSDLFPLKKFNPTKVLNFQGKELSIISSSSFEF